MATHKWSFCSETTQTGSWTDWHPWNDGGTAHKLKAQHDGTYIHMLIAEANVSSNEADANHVHVKYRDEHGTDVPGHAFTLVDGIPNNAVLASVAQKDIRVINRGKLLDSINRVLGTSFRLG